MESLKTDVRKDGVVRIPRPPFLVGLSLLLVAACASRLQRPASDELAGTSWRLVKISMSDASTYTPDDRSKYTIAFGADGKASIRVDCNRGMGGWRSEAPSHLEFGSIATTKAMCAPGSLHDRFLSNLPTSARTSYGTDICTSRYTRTLGSSSSSPFPNRQAGSMLLVCWQGGS